MHHGKKIALWRRISSWIFDSINKYFLMKHKVASLELKEKYQCSYRRTRGPGNECPPFCAYPSPAFPTSPSLPPFADRQTQAAAREAASAAVASSLPANCFCSGLGYDWEVPCQGSRPVCCSASAGRTNPSSGNVSFDQGNRCTPPWEQKQALFSEQVIQKYKFGGAFNFN